MQTKPDSAAYRIALQRAQLTASRIHFDKGRELETKGDLEGAIGEFQKAAALDPSNRRATEKASELEQKLRARAEAARPKPQIEQMKERAKQATEPLLNPASRQPLFFKFAANIAVRQILDILGQASGINVVFESTFADTTTKSAIDLDGVTLEQALNVVMTANNLFYKVLNPKSILVIPDTPQARIRTEDQVIQTFPLSHADAMTMQTLLNGLLVAQTQQASRPQIMPNKDSNSITIRGSASMVAIAGRIIENNDKPHAEVVIDVEILEVNRTRVKWSGLNLSNFQIGLQFSPEGPPGGSSTTTGTTTANPSGSFNLNSVAHGINTADFYGSIPSAVVKFLESDSQTKLIAKPSLRGTEGKKLTANLGDQIPVPSTTVQPLVSGGAGINPFTSFAYKDVGVNVEVTPRVSLDDDIVLELTVESSTKGSDVNVAGQNLPSFGSRKVTTTMRLHDGESNLLAGLLRDDERKSLVGFPGGIHVPIIEDLFSANDSQIAQTDIVMLLTPHIIRTQEITERNLQAIYIGTASNPVIGGAPALLGGSPGAEAPAPQGAPAPAPLGPPITTQPYGTPGAALVGGAPVGNPTPQGTPVVPPGSSPIPGTVMMPPPQSAAQAPPPVQAPAQAAPPAQPAAPVAAPAAPPVAAPTAASGVPEPGDRHAFGFRLAHGPGTVYGRVVGGQSEPRVDDQLDADLQPGNAEGQVGCKRAASCRRVCRRPRSRTRRTRPPVGLT